MRRVVVGTAGHIDHGKTSLVAALTGIDCDRWAQEKERGITIDLGFAHLHADDLQVGFVDVPGHERFIHNALAGLGGIDLMVLVVAADEGVKPQTHEHLAICSLLQIPAGLAVLTKADLVAADLLELAQLELQEVLASTPFEGVPILAASSRSGAGIPELQSKLVELAAGVDSGAARLALPARLPVDRSFHLTGMGVLVTGTLMSGRIRAGDTLELLPAAQAARVRSIQVHGEEREEALAGERTSLQLTGVALSEVTRGMQLASPGALKPSRRVLADLRLLSEAPKPIDGPVPARIHLASSQCVGRLRPLDGARLEPGGRGMVEILLQEPVVAVRGDRFIVRRPSPQNTLGGGEVLDPHWTGRRGRRLEGALEALAGDTNRALLFWVQELGEGGAELEPLAQRLGKPSDEVEARLNELVQDQRLLAAGSGRQRRWIVPAAYQRIVRRATRTLQEFFKRDRLAPGMSKAEAVGRVLPGRGAELADVYLGWLEKQGVVEVRGGLLKLPGRGGELTEVESALASQIVRAFESGNLTPPSPESVCQQLGAKRQLFDGVLRYLVSRGRLVRLPSGLVISSSALDTLRLELRDTGWESFNVGQFKDRFGLSRKWAIPLLEHLDANRVTARVGDQRKLLPEAG